MAIVLERRAGEISAAVDGAEPVLVADLVSFVGMHEPTHPRWVWDDTTRWYPELLAARVRVERCFDLRLCHAILRNSALTSGSELARAARGVWDAPTPVEPPVRASSTDTLFETLFDFETLDEGADGAADQTDDETADEGGAGGADSRADSRADSGPDSRAELALQLAAVESSDAPERIRLLLAAESAGALIAAEMHVAGLPWRADEHDAILTRMLGARPSAGQRPERLHALLELIRELLEAPDLNPDSPADLLRALGRTGLQITSTRSWELKKLKHPAIEPLLEYKKLARLASANGWHWLDTWVVDGRFRPDYVPGGVVTGRWATSGGGALQLPKQIRGAVIADPGWTFVVADASQLEPRILAALSGDAGMIAAGAAGDLYEGIVASGAVGTRDQAKVAMLGAMYGATTGESGRLMPRLAKAYPRAIGMVEDAARAGERGEVVSTRLGRSSPPGRDASYDESASEADVARARGRARAWGRFTRNFIVQGTAAEWALCWMAGIRRRLVALSDEQWLTDAPHLVFFLHDEIVVHCPVHLADRVALEVEAAAVDAGRLIFGPTSAAFPVTVAIVADYGQAK